VIELVVTLTLLGVVATMILGTLRGQQRFQIGMMEILDAKRSAHHAVDVLYAGLRATSSRDIYAIADSSIALRATHGASYICAIDSGRASITLPSSADGADLSTFLTMPRAGDSLVVLDSGESPAGDDDRWSAHVLSSDPTGGVCPMRPAGLSKRPDAQGIAIALLPQLSGTIHVGSPVRFFRATRYSLYRGTGSEWMLGYSTCAAGACSARQPLSGPYLPFRAQGLGGVAFQFFDAPGAPTSDPRGVARIDVVARTRSASRIDAAHLRAEHYYDSAAMTIALRNSS
jgi:type II secretory pathway pseudopilin PulG